MSTELLTTRPAPRPARRGRQATDADLLFDVPGPVGRRRLDVLSAVAILIIVALVALLLLKARQVGVLDYPRWRYFLGASTVTVLGKALRDTLLAALIAAVLSFPLGVLLGVARLSASRVVRAVVGTWIDAMRAVPMLLLVYFFLLAFRPLTGVTLSALWLLVIPIVMCTSATTAEVFRSGVLALDRGQSEAATALGLSRGQTMRLILAPQALRLMLPTLVTQLVTILKDSSLGYVVSYAELMYAGSVLIADTRLKQHMDIYLPTYVIIAALYVVINWGLGALARVVEARTR